MVVHRAWFAPEGSALGKEYEAAYFRFSRVAQEIFRLAHLLAFTIDAPGYSRAGQHFAAGWARARMWEQYAEKHAGVCLVFDRERLLTNISTALANQIGVRPYSGRVVYSEEGGARYQHLSGDSLPPDLSEEFVTQWIEQHKDELFFQKTLDWQSEHEFRIATTANPDEELRASYGDALVGLVIGAQVPSWERPGILEMAHDCGIEPALMNWSTRLPFLVPFVRESREEREIFEANRRGRSRPGD